jgi:uncharacterized protein
VWNGKNTKLLRIHLAEADTRAGKPLYEAVVDKCREMGIAGATVFRGLEGYGETAEVHRRRLLHRDQPVLIVVVDEEDKINALVPEVEKIMHSGLLVMSGVRAIRVTKGAVPNA